MRTAYDRSAVGPSDRKTDMEQIRKCPSFNCAVRRARSKQRIVDGHAVPQHVGGCIGMVRIISTHFGGVVLHVCNFTGDFMPPVYTHAASARETNTMDVRILSILSN